MKVKKDVVFKFSGDSSGESYNSKEETDVQPSCAGTCMGTPTCITEWDMLTLLLVYCKEVLT